MMASASEKMIRDAVVLRLRECMPKARIIHELNVASTSSNRIDVVAVSPHSIVAVEIKSEKDTLARLDEQWPAFNACCHRVIVAAHQKHFQEYRWQGMRADVQGPFHLKHPLFESRNAMESDLVWRFPKPEPYSQFRPAWPLNGFRDVRSQPRAANMLGMLWAEELRFECARHRLSSSRNRTRQEMIEEMVWLMTGREICEAVCRQLRAREFIEADPAI